MLSLKEDIMKLRYKGFLIKSISYDLKRAPKKGKTYCDMQVDDGQVSLSQGDTPSVVIGVNVKAFSKNEGESEKAQTLEISVDWIFEVESQEKDVHKIDGPEFRKLVETYGMNFCMIRSEELVKQLTSIDYGRPILVQKVEVPNGITLQKPDNTNSEDKDE